MEGIAFGVGFVFLLFVHELGHGAAMRAAGIRAGWPIFIPFFGAFISMKDQPAHSTIEARIAFAGPMAGTGAAIVCAAIGLALKAPFFLALAYSGFFLNLFNLVPLGFLHGARIARVFSRGAWIVGALLLGALFLVSPSPQLLLIGLMGLGHVFRRSNEGLELVTDADRRTWAFRYFGLCFLLGAAVLFTRQLLERSALNQAPTFYPGWVVCRTGRLSHRRCTGTLTAPMLQPGLNVGEGWAGTQPRREPSSDVGRNQRRWAGGSNVGRNSTSVGRPQRRWGRDSINVGAGGGPGVGPRLQRRRDSINVGAGRD